MSGRLTTEEIEQYLFNFLRDFSTPAPPPMPVPVPTPPAVEPRNHSDLLVQTICEIILDYNQNIHEYQENTRRFLQIVSDLNANRRTVPLPSAVPVQAPLPSARQGTAPRPTAAQASTRSTNITPLASSILFRAFRTMIPETNRAAFQDIIVSPTRQQITDATRSVIYSTNVPFNNTRCPITLEEFQEDDTVAQISRCGHSFRPNAIQNWFRISVRCPVCRFDIRDTMVNELTDSHTIDEEGLFDDEVMATLSGSNGTVFTFEFPLTSIEPSGNYV